MKKFAFPLEQVMKYREHVQSQAELDLGRAMAKEREIQVQLDEVAAQHVSMTNYMRGVTDFKEITSAHNFFSLLDQQKEYLLGEMAKAKLVSEQKRKVLQEAMQKTESLHKLRERKFDEYKEAENHEAFDIADDMTNARAGRIIR
ncbi:MAG: flagellar export protein FliJ [Treponema sp.]|nr:flagellar export protein FliJ [Treponema sp.]